MFCLRYERMNKRKYPKWNLLDHKRERDKTWLFLFNVGLVFLKQTRPFPLRADEYKRHTSKKGHLTKITNQLYCFSYRYAKTQMIQFMCALFYHSFFSLRTHAKSSDCLMLKFLNTAILSTGTFNIQSWHAHALLMR